MNRYPVANHPNQIQNNVPNTPNIAGAQKIEN